MLNLSKFSSLFDKLARQEDGYKVFDSFLDYKLSFFDDERKDENVMRIFDYLRLKEAPEVFQQMFLEIHSIVTRVKGEYIDPLGEFFEMRFANSKRGQFFTPGSVAQIAVQIAGIHDGPDEFAKTVLDPAVGSGRILLEAAKIYPHYLFFGADISPLCCKIATLNLLMNGLVGEISHMNSLTNQFYSCWIVIARESGNLLLPKHIHTTDPNRSRIHLKIKK